ncbi:MAG: magnesium transporter CorA family protein [Deltaproteobacteria bacterium]|nr:magnesium transporter CorA family protein [Deltaproteobacteria bacterium]
MASLPTQAVTFNLTTREIKKEPLDSFSFKTEKPEEIYWIHLNSLESALLEKARARLDLSEELVGELTAVESLPDLTEAENHITLTLYYWLPPREGEEPAGARRLMLHLTPRYCLTVAPDPIPALEAFNATYTREFRFAQTTGFMLFLVLDNLVDDYGKMLRTIDQTSEAIDDQIHIAFNEKLNTRILDLKRNIITLKRTVSSLRDILMRLSGRKIPVISESCRQSLGDVYNHAQIATVQLESLRELVSGSLDAYNAALSQKMNETMKVLTLFASITLPMSLIAGIYGMNVPLPGSEHPLGLAIVLGLMITSGVGLYAFFKKRGWF